MWPLLIPAMISAVGQIAQGAASQKAAKWEAKQLEYQAGQQRASAQRGAYFAEEQSQLIASRALAVAAASGGGASDPGVLSLMADNAARGAYLKQLALYEGEEKGLLMESQADARRMEGRQAMIGSVFKTASSLASGYANAQSMSQKYFGPIDGRIGGGY